MNESSLNAPDQASSGSKFDDVLADYLRAIEADARPSREALLDQYPELAGELRQFFDNHDRMDQLAQPLVAPASMPLSSKPPEKIRYFGDYELLEEIGRGGMGVIYKALQVSLNRLVAVKMILKGTLATDEDIHRFRAEAEAAGNLQHPAIVAIHEVGLHEGQHYFSMDFVEGHSLAQLPREQPLSARQAAEYVRDAAGAVYYAHQQGTLHRDLKPSNILIDGQRRVRITDFGLAKRITGGSDLTLTGQILGTPSYMPPEQALGKRSLIGAASDIYSLGAVLYELLTGRPPFRGESPAETLRQVENLDPLSPHLLSPTVPRDLETICLKCLEKEPHKRYGTAQLLADDLRRYLGGEAVLARAPSALYRFGKFARRNMSAFALSAVVSAALLLGFVGLAVTNARIRRESQAKEQALREKDTALSSARYQEGLATQNAATAIANLRKAREAVDRMLTHVAETDLSQIPQMEQVKRKLLEDALKFNQEFLAGDTADPELRFEAALAHVRLAKINQDLGNRQLAEIEHRRAIGMLEALSSDLPREPRYRHHLAITYDALTVALTHAPPAAEEERILRKSLELMNQLIVEFPTAKYQGTRAEAGRLLGGLLINLNRDGEAETILRLALQDSQQLGDLLNAGIARKLLSNLYLRAGRLEESQTQVQAAIDLLQQRLKDAPEHAWARQTLGEMQALLGEVLNRLGRLKESEEALTAALHVYGRLAREFPSTIGYPTRLAEEAKKYGDRLRREGRDEDAMGAYRTALDAFGRLVALQPTEAKWHNYVRICHHEIDLLFIKAGHVGQRQDLAAQTAAHYQSLIVEHPDHTVLRAEYDRLQMLFIEQGIQRGPFDEQKQMADEGIDRLQRRTAEQPADPAIRDELARRYSQMAVFLKANGQSQEAAKALEDAERTYRQAIDFYSRLATAAPTETSVLVNSIQFLDGLEQLLKQQRKIDEVLAVFRQTNEIVEKMITANPTDAALRESSARRHLVQGRYSPHPHSAEAFRRGVAVYEKLITDFPDKAAYSQALDQANLGLVWVLNDGGHPKEAEALCREQIARVEKALAESGQRPVDLRLLGDLLFGLGFAIRYQGRFDESMQVFRHNLETREKLLATTEATSLDRHEHRRTQRALGWVLVLNKQLDEAVAWFRRSFKAAQKLAAEFPTESTYQAGLAQSHLDLAEGLKRIGQVAEAAEHYQQAIAMSDNEASSAGLCSNVAWLLATCADEKSRDPARAVEYAKKAVELAPGLGSFWTTLGAAQYRAGDFSAAVEALTKAQKLRGGNDTRSYFLLAMAHWQLGHHDEARRLYDKAAAWAAAISNKNASNNEELIRFRAEASELMKQEAGVKTQEPAKPADATSPDPRPAS